MEKQLSISIASYNVEKYLNQTLDSFICKKEIMDQIEVLIVNDGSKDKTCEVATKYVEKYPKTFVLIDKQNGGYGSTINASLKVAKGKYFKLVDGDDWVDTLQLEEFVEKLKDENADLVITKYIKYDETNGNEEVITENFEYDGLCKSIEDITLDKNFAMHQITYKTDLLRNIKLQITEKCFYTDFEYIIKPLPYIKTVTCLNYTIYKYRIGREGQSVMLSSWFKNIEQGIKVSTNLSEYYELKKMDITSEKMRQYIKDSISDSVKNKYIYITLMPSDRKPKEIITSLDKNIKKTSIEIYKNVLKVSPKIWRYIILSLRISHFITFKIINVIVRRRNHEKLS